MIKMEKISKEEEKKEELEHFKSSIKFYRPNQKFGFMSNFYPSPIEVDGKTYPTSEHYF